MLYNTIIFFEVCIKLYATYPSSHVKNSKYSCALNRNQHKVDPQPTYMFGIHNIYIYYVTLSLLSNVAIGVITFLCTRRCYMKSSPPSPNEKSVYYETVHSDSVQMQPSPAYESVDKVL